MKFKDYKYERCEVSEINKECEIILNKLKEASEYEEFKRVFTTFDQLQRHVITMESLIHTRYTIDTEDSYLNEENEYWDENSPLIAEAFNKIKKYILTSSFLGALSKELPETYILSIKNELRVFDEAIIPELQEENKLVSSYQKLIASAQIPFMNETYTLASLIAKVVDNKAEIREKSFKAYWNWYEENEEVIDTIYDKLVHVRDTMAKKLGFKDYVEMGYIRMNRFDYDRDDVANYRRQVLEDVVPVANRLYERQRERLGLDSLKCFDEKFEFASGNPAPKYPTGELVKRANEMYHELSKPTGEFFDFMMENELLDLDAKKGKASGGYCTCFLDYKSPFIFSNFNGTNDDVETLTHEAGHAFQVYSSMNIFPAECVWPTMESAEIHSMSMEFLTWPWMKNFFEEDIDKFYFLHLGGAIKFIPYGILVDHYQHVVYENPNMSADERKKAWRDLEKQYLPHKNYDDCKFLEKGTWWFRQSHIFINPFYYVDYTLAQVCALQFWNRSYHKDETVFDDYYKICKLGGTKTFTKIVKAANLKVPFSDGCLKDVMKNANDYLNEIEDTKL